MTNTNTKPINMKKTILTLTISAFVAGAFAGEACCAKDKSACADKNKTTCAGKSAAGCPLSKGKCPAGGETAKASSKKLPSPKDAAAGKS